MCMYVCICIFICFVYTCIYVVFMKPIYIYIYTHVEIYICVLLLGGLGGGAYFFVGALDGFQLWTIAGIHTEHQQLK